MKNFFQKEQKSFFLLQGQTLKELLKMRMQKKFVKTYERGKKCARGVSFFG